jgi:hypothetical protein
MGSDEPQVRVHQPRPVRPIEVKTYLMTCQAKFTLYRNKKIYEIKKKKEEIISALKQNNIDIAKSKMESIMRLEELITVYDILSPLCEVLKERITDDVLETQQYIDEISNKDRLIRDLLLRLDEDTRKEWLKENNYERYFDKKKRIKK